MEISFNLAAPPGFRGLDPYRPVTVYYRHLPHWRQEGATYFVTFRLNDSLPQSKIRELESYRRHWELSHPPPRNEDEWKFYVKEVVSKVEHWLDQGHGACYFRDREAAKHLADALLFFQNKRCFVSCSVVMPNHCHVIVRPLPGYDLEAILKSWKGHVARQINLAIGSTGCRWQPESFDRIIRDEEHLYRVVQYIGRNAANAGLTVEQCNRWIDPSWQSAGWEFEDKRDTATP